MARTTRTTTTAATLFEVPAPVAPKRTRTPRAAAVAPATPAKRSTTVLKDKTIIIKPAARVAPKPAPAKAAPKAAPKRTVAPKAAPAPVAPKRATRKPAATVPAIAKALVGLGGTTEKMALRVAEAYVDGVQANAWRDGVAKGDARAAMIHGCGPSSDGRRRGDLVLAKLATFAKPRA